MKLMNKSANSIISAICLMWYRIVRSLQVLKEMQYLKRNKPTTLAPQIFIPLNTTISMPSVNTGKYTENINIKVLICINYFPFFSRYSFSFCYVFSHFGFWWDYNIKLLKYIIRVTQPTSDTRRDTRPKLPIAENKCHCRIYAFIFGLSGKSIYLKIHKTWDTPPRIFYLIDTTKKTIVNRCKINNLLNFTTRTCYLITIHSLYHIFSKTLQEVLGIS